ncbi:MAG: A/G-specific adenine glycosylase [Gammaproteobacteria bacterium]
MRSNRPPVPAVPADIGSAFAPALIEWQARCGRHGLPWQGTRDPYRVWLSEVMLQQTQVATVLSYYPRFLARFGNVQALAEASVDEVMALWSGLGYYSRARNLHRCARMVVSDHGGVFPASAQALATLPGIGASTAAAIAAFCHGERVSIADGNVRRVLSRVLAYEGDLAQAAGQAHLWDVAQQLAPAAPSLADMQAYTQGLMDLGATVCTRSRPACTVCPMAGVCRGRQQGDPARFPVKTRRVARRHESWWLLAILRKGPGGTEVWLERRPAPGIWAGLHCLPVFANEPDAALCLPGGLDAAMALPVIAHALTHRELRLHPLSVNVEVGWQPDRPAGRWWPLARLDEVGMPVPVKELLSGF